MGIGQAPRMPTFFASNAIYPVALMPAWLQIVARTNPLTYDVDGLRSVMLTGGSSVYGLGDDLAVLALAGLLIIAIATRMYPRLPE
jgi:ABC-2 type transport system permease protein